MDYQDIERIVCDTILKMQTSSVIRLNVAKKLIDCYIEASDICTIHTMNGYGSSRRV